LFTWYRGSHIVTGIWDGILAQLGLNVLMKKEISGLFSWIKISPKETEP
jgi:hypothetical protein